jgi:hypothetical protein
MNATLQKILDFYSDNQYIWVIHRDDYVKLPDTIQPEDYGEGDYLLVMDKSEEHEVLGGSYDISINSDGEVEMIWMPYPEDYTTIGYTNIINKLEQSIYEYLHRQ